MIAEGLAEVLCASMHVSIGSTERARCDSVIGDARRWVLGTLDVVCIQGHPEKVYGCSGEARRQHCIVDRSRADHLLQAFFL